MKQSTIIILLCLLISYAKASADEQQDNTFGGWEHISINYPIKNSDWFVNLYYEHDNYQYKRLDSSYASIAVGYNFTNWLKADAAYHFMMEPDQTAHRAIAEVTGTLKQGNLSVSLRERYQHKWANGSSDQTNELRSRLKTQYAIPGTRFMPYLALEVYSWEEWIKTRHYVGTEITINKNFGLDIYYNYYVFESKPAEHVLGIGLNIDL